MGWDPPELDQSRFPLMQRQGELPKAFLKIGQCLLERPILQRFLGFRLVSLCGYLTQSLLPCSIASEPYSTRQKLRNMHDLNRGSPAV